MATDSNNTESLAPHHSSTSSPQPDSENAVRSLETKIAHEKGAITYIHGPRFWFISSTIAAMMFMTNLEVPIVVTAVVAITGDLGGFDNVGWVVASYLLGYIAVIVIFAKFSDIFTRKFIFLLSIAIFTIFSAACAAAQTIVQLIVFRAFQGIGGGGCFSLCTIMITDLVPPEKLKTFVSNVSIVNAIALLIGPVLGGAISENTTWRWIFIINIPVSVAAFIIAYVAIPKNFPYQNNNTSTGIRGYISKLFSAEAFGRVDLLGTILVLFATLALTAGFEEADRRFPWRSAYVITLLTSSGLFWVALLFWERYVTQSNGSREPVLPWRFFTNRQMIGILLNFIFLGGPTIIGMFILPQRFQLVYNLSGLEAGVRLIPFTITIPAGTIFASAMSERFKIPALYLIFLGSALQVIGFALLGTLPTSLEIPPQLYGFEIIAGWGCGINFALLFIMIPFVNEERDRAVGMGAGAQFRTMGSSMALAISTSVFNTYVRPELVALLGYSEMAFAGDVAGLPTSLQHDVRHVLARGYNNQILVLCVSAALQFPASLLMWKKNQVRV
ncbi:putative multidrug resistance protein fnx1 [Stachybotrys elegans]|uniref:Multidrug resistance protein fnx1 n=1 Tax=Stachybotrys elegans TaxID=80388 RepID=A0A8K0WXU0_9HYPO|nr:putative multidrug resistance protein fnx1 [Stachybotrys elegans]